MKFAINGSVIGVQCECHCYYTDGNVAMKILIKDGLFTITNSFLIFAPSKSISGEF